MFYNIENTAAIGKPKDVYLDGKKMDKVLEADTDNGFVVVLKIDENGLICIDRNGELETEKLFGEVKVVPFGE